MKINTICVGEYQVNCYVLKQENDSLVIDPGDDVEKIIDAIPSDSHLKGILLTHGHFDHIGAVDDLVSRYQCPVYCCLKESDLLTNPKLNSLGQLSARVKSKLTPLHEGSWKCGNFEITNYFTPGHTVGSMCFQIENILFTGDTLFYRSIGRTDLFSANEVEMMKTIEKIKKMDPSLLVYPGHGPTTTIEEEIKFNPYF